MELFADLHRSGHTILMVTHNPELTRYASRVIYMRDGMVVEEESTSIGAIAKGALRTYLRKRKTTEEDVLAGVSALLKDVPGQAMAEEERRPRKKAKLRKTRRAKRKARR